MNKCEQCGMNLEPCIDLIFNGVHYCPNCMVLITFNQEDKLLETNTLVDNDYTYYLSKNILTRLIGCNLTKKQYFKFKEKYPKSWYIHDDFYDEEGKRLQPKY